MNLCFLQLNGVHNPNGKSIGLAVFAQLTAESPYTLQWASLSPKLPLSIGDLDPHLLYDFSGQFEPVTQTVSPSVQPFLYTNDRRVSLYFTMGYPPPSKLPLPVGDVDPDLMHGSLGPPKSSTQTASRLFQLFLQSSLMWQTGRQTDRPTDHATRSVTMGCIYVRSTAMRPNNNGWRWLVW